MFVTSPGPAVDRSEADPADTARARESLALLAERARPLAASQTRLLPVVPPLAGLFPDGGLRRGTTIVVRRPGHRRWGRPRGRGVGERGPGPGGGGLGRRLVVRGGRSGRARGGGRPRHRHRPRPVGRGPPAPGRLGRGHRGGASTASTWWSSSLPSLPVRPWPAGWWPGPGIAGRCWW